MQIFIKGKENRLVKAKQRIIYIIFAHTSLYVMVLQVGKICVLDLLHNEVALRTEAKVGWAPDFYKFFQK